MIKQSTNRETPAVATSREQALAAINQALDGLKFGTIILTVHDSRVVQLEVTEKKRFGS